MKIKKILPYVCSVILLIALVATSISFANYKKVAPSKTEYQEKVSLMQTQIDTLESSVNDDASKKEISTVCQQFLKGYYEIHSKKSVALTRKENCKPYLTEKYYNSLFPDYGEQEQPYNDFDYTSTVLVHNSFSGDITKDTAIYCISAKVQMNTNNIRRDTENFMVFNLQKEKTGWLISNFSCNTVEG